MTDYSKLEAKIRKYALRCGFPSDCMETQAADAIVDLQKQLDEHDTEIESWKARCIRRVDDIKELVTRNQVEVDAHKERLAQAIAACAAKDEALTRAMCVMDEDEVPATYAQLLKALAIQPDDTALREWGAKLLEAYERDAANEGTKCAFEFAQDLRSGEWKP